MKSPKTIRYKLEDIVIPPSIEDSVIIREKELIDMQKNIREILNVLPKREKAMLGNIDSLEEVYKLQQLVHSFKDWDIYVETINPFIFFHRVIFKRKK